MFTKLKLKSYRNFYIASLPYSLFVFISLYVMIIFYRVKTMWDRDRPGQVWSSQVGSMGQDIQSTLGRDHVKLS